MNLHDAADLAEKLRHLLEPHCERIEVAGSIRRRKPTDIKDIELVAIPRLIAHRNGLFGDFADPKSALDVYLEETVEDPGLIPLGKDALRPPHWGPRSKRLRYAGVAVDLFIVLPPAQWGVIYAIRTGPADWSRRLATSRMLGGLLPPNYQIAQGGLFRDGNPVDVPEESDLFEHLGLPWKEPTDRR